MTVVIYGIGIVLTFLSLLSQTELWQRKEYRWDRLKSYLRSPESRPLYWPWALLATSVIELGWLASMRDETLLAEIFGWTALIAFVCHFARRFFQRGVARPEFTSKAILILGLSTAIIFLHLWRTFVPQEQTALQWATLIWLIPFIVTGVVAVVNAIATFRKRQIIRQAIQYRQRFPQAVTVGITGSYGKTSTKHFAMQLIPGAIGTPEHRNTEIGVAQDVLKQFKKDTKIYIAEMGAYRRGEIARLARIVQPTIGVITAIGNQHLDLFGSKEAILKTKWELIAALPSSGTAILNADDPLLRAQKTTVPTLWYSLTKPADIYVSQVKVNAKNIECELHVGKLSRKVSIPLASEGLLYSVVAAVALAVALKVDPKEIFAALPHLRPFPHTMEIIAGKNGATIIDDGYAANEPGVLNALHHLKQFTDHDRRIVLMPLIELGADAPLVHQRIGKVLSELKAKVFLTNDAYYKDIVQGLGAVDPSLLPIVINEPKKLAASVSANLSQQTVVLLEGRIPDVVRQALKHT